MVSLHDLNMLEDHFDRVLALRQGTVFWQGSPAELTGDLVKEIYGAEYRAMHGDELGP